MRCAPIRGTLIPLAATSVYAPSSPPAQELQTDNRRLDNCDGKISSTCKQ